MDCGEENIITQSRSCEETESLSMHAVDNNSETSDNSTKTDFKQDIKHSDEDGDLHFVDIQHLKKVDDVNLSEDIEHCDTKDCGDSEYLQQGCHNGYEPFMFKNNAIDEASFEAITDVGCKPSTIDNCIHYNRTNQDDFEMVVRLDTTDIQCEEKEEDLDETAVNENNEAAENDSTKDDIDYGHNIETVESSANSSGIIEQLSVEPSEQVCLKSETDKIADENGTLNEISTPKDKDIFGPIIDKNRCKTEKINDMCDSDHGIDDTDTDQSFGSETTIVEKNAKISRKGSNILKNAIDFILSHKLRACIFIFELMLVILLAYLYNPLPSEVQEQVTVQTTLMMSGLGHVIAHTMAFLGLGPFSANLRWVLDTALDKNLSSKHFRDVVVTRVRLAGVPCVIYRPVSLGETAAPAALFFHGGGFVVGSVASSDLTTYTMAKEAQIVVISVEYPLAPEHPFPAAPEDCIKVTSYVLREGEGLWVDTRRVGVAGASAGGNLAAVVAWTLKKENSSLPPLAFQVLYYPIMQGVDLATPSHINNDAATPNFLSRRYTGYMLASYMGFNDKEAFAAADVIESNRHVPEKIRKRQYAKFLNIDLIPDEFIHFTTAYRNKQADVNLYNKIKATLEDPRFSPLMVKDSELVGLPPTFIHAAEFDILRDDALMYAERLRRAGVATELYLSRGGYHSEATVFSGGLMRTTASGRRALNASFAFIRDKLGIN